MGNLLVMHGGAPTAVINASLYGSLSRARSLGFSGKLLAARYGTGGLLRQDIIDLTNVPDSDYELLVTTPGSAIGTGRDHLDANDYDHMIEILKKLDVGYVLHTGGNGSMDSAFKLSEAAKGSGITVCGVPKTMDNDLSITDHSPGFGSAARYIAGTVREVANDVRGLPIHIVVIETFGRNAGWITASGEFARTEEIAYPDMVLLPEVAFDQEKFLKRATELYKEKGGVIVLASEGLKDGEGNPIVDPIFQVGRSVYYGDVSSHLANLIIKETGIKARSEKPGILGRASEKWVSIVDRKEAIECGRVAFDTALEKKNGYMSIIRRNDGEYNVTVDSAMISSEILKERTVPLDWIDQENFKMKQEFIDYARPLLGGDLGKYISFT